LKSRIYNISATDAINSLQSRYFDIDEEGNVTLITDMFTNSSSGRKTPSDGLNWETPTETAYRQSMIANSNAAAQNTGRDLLNSGRTNQSSNSTNRLYVDRSITRQRSSQNQLATPNVQNYLLSENPNLNQPYQIKNFSDGRDILVMNKTLDYKSVIFSIDSSLSSTWKNWVRCLYVPGTPFSNVIIIPQKKSVGLLSYEINNKNIPYLLNQTFQSAGKKMSHAIDNVGFPMLFYKKNAVIMDENSILTLYFDPEQNKLGLAIVKW
jgi:formylmethanofuran dehydrogenase subunit D